MRVISQASQFYLKEIFGGRPRPEVTDEKHFRPDLPAGRPPLLLMYMQHPEAGNMSPTLPP